MKVGGLKASVLLATDSSSGAEEIDGRRFNVTGAGAKASTLLTDSSSGAEMSRRRIMVQAWFISCVARRSERSSAKIHTNSSVPAELRATQPSEVDR